MENTEISCILYRSNGEYIMQKMLYQWQLSPSDPFRVEEQIIPPDFYNPHYDMHSAVHFGILRRGAMGNMSCQYDLFLTGSWEVHGNIRSAGGAEMLLITVLPEAVLNCVIGDRQDMEKLLYMPSFHTPERFRIQELQLLLQDFCSFYDGMKSGDAGYRQKLWLQIVGLLCDTARLIRKIPAVTEQKKFQVLQKVFAAMAALNKLPFTLADASEACCLSESYFSHLFREYTGMSFAKYELAFRLNGAAAELSSTHASIKQVASEWGFYDVSHFSKSYKKHFGIAPSLYRGK